MALKAQMDSLDGVEDSVRELYRQADDGKYYLDVEGAEALPSVRGLVSTLKKYKEVAPSAHGLKQKLDRVAELEAFAEIGRSADEVREALKRLEEIEAGGAKADADRLRETYEKQKQALKAQMDAQLKERQEEIDRLSSFIEQATVDSEISRALDKVGVIPEAREAVKALLKFRRPKVVRDESGYRGVFETESGLELSVAEYVEAWATRDEAAVFLPASGNKGSGARQGGAAAGASGRTNPFRPETRNVTEQMRLTRENPALARQLAIEAGVQLPKIGEAA